MKLTKTLLSATLLLLCACGGDQQGQSTAPTCDTLQTSVVTLKECDEITRPITFFNKENPFYILKNVEDVEAEINECKSLTKAVLRNGKVIDVKFKGYQPGEGNQGTLVSSNYKEEWTGVEYESNYRTQKKDDEESGFLFNDAYTSSHRVAKLEVKEPAQLSTEEESFVKEHYPNLTIDRICQSITYENGDAKIFTIQFKPSNNKALAINVFEKGGKYYINEEWGIAEEEPISVWNVDDGGEYICPIFFAMVANDLSHYDLFYEQSAVESYTVGRCRFSQDSLIQEDLESYYITVDYQSRRVPEAWMVKREWEKIFECKDCAPAEYVVVDLNEDGTKELICRNKEKDQIAAFQFINGSLDLYTSNYNIVTSSTITFELYKTGVRSSGGVAALSIETVVPYNKDGGITKYMEIAGGPTLEYKKQLYGSPEPIEESLFLEEKGKLKEQITDLDSFDWKPFREN